MSEPNGGFQNRAYSEEDRDENENLGGVAVPNIVVYIDPADDGDDSGDAGKVSSGHQNGGYSNGNGFLHPEHGPR